MCRVKFIRNYIPIIVLCVFAFFESFSAGTCFAQGADGNSNIIEIINQLKSDNALKRKDAVENLSVIEVDDPDLVPALCNALNSKDPQVVLAVLKALEQIGPEASGAASKVIPFMVNTKEVYEQATRTILAMGPEVAPVLKPFLKSPSLHMRYAVIWIVIQMPECASECLDGIIECTKSPDDKLRNMAGFALSRVDRIESRHLPAVFNILCEVKIDLLLTTPLMPLIVDHQQAAIDLMIEVLNTSDNAHRCHCAALVLQNIGPPAIRSTEILHEKLKDAEHPIFYVYTISFIDPASEEALDKCLDLHEMVLPTSQQIILSRSIAMFAKCQEEAANALMRDFNSNDSNLRAVVVEAIGYAQYYDWKGRDIILRGLGDPSPRVNAYAITAGAELDGEIYDKALYMMEKFACIENDDLRCLGAEICLRLARKKDFGTFLCDFLDINNKSIRADVASAAVELTLDEVDITEYLQGDKHLGKCDILVGLAANGVAHKYTVEAIAACCQNKDFEVRQAAADCAVVVDDDHIGIVMPELIKLLDDYMPSVRLAAARTLCKFEAKAKPAMSKLIEKISNGNESTELRVLCVHALGNIGVDAAIAIPALKKQLYDGDRQVRAAINGAILKIKSAGLSEK